MEGLGVEVEDEIEGVVDIVQAEEDEVVVVVDKELEEAAPVNEGRGGFLFLERSRLANAFDLGVICRASSGPATALVRGVRGNVVSAVARN